MGIKILQQQWVFCPITSPHFSGCNGVVFFSSGIVRGHISVLLMQLNVLLLAFFGADLSAHFAFWFFTFNWATFLWRMCLLESSHLTDDKVTPLSDFFYFFLHYHKETCAGGHGSLLLFFFNDSPKSTSVAIAMIDLRLWVTACDCDLLPFRHKGQELGICVWMCRTTRGSNSLQPGG